MSFTSERRKYQRCYNMIGKVIISYNERDWMEIDLCDVSANGLRFMSNSKIDLNSKLYVHMYIYNMLSEFSLRFEADVLRYDNHSGKNEYAAKFCNVDKYKLIQLDEIVKSKISIRDIPKSHMQEENNHALQFVPRAHSRRIKLY
jgi:hypothetical protein